MTKMDQKTIEKDCTPLLTLNVNDFITAVYHELLEREPDNEGFTNYIRLIYQGMSKEVVIYLIASSPEFAERFIIKDLIKYEKIYKKHIIKTKIKKLPVIGWCIKFSHINDVLAKLNIMEADIIINELRLQEKLKKIQTDFDNALNIIIGNFENNTKMLSEKLDATNVNIAEKLDATNELVNWAKNNMDVQRIIGKGLSPECGFEAIQAELICLLNDKTDEFEAYNQLPIEQIVDYAEGKTVVAGYYSHLISNYASKNNMPEIEAVGIEPALLPQICREKDTLIISNPTLAALVLTSPVLLKEIAQKLNRNLILVIHGAVYPLNAVWEGFSFIENEEGKGIFRWAQCGCGNWRIRMINFLSRPVEAKFCWSSDSLCGIGKLTASCCGKIISVELNDYVEVNLNVTLRPGVNYLYFNFSGPAKSPGQDKRILAFRIFNFCCNIENQDIGQEYFYNKHNVSSLSGDYIRRTLHQNGFYDVISTAYANHGVSKRELVTTRYKYPLDYRIVSKAEKDVIESDEIICYKAFRLRHTDDMTVD